MARRFGYKFFNGHANFELRNMVTPCYRVLLRGGLLVSPLMTIFCGRTPDFLFDFMAHGNIRTFNGG